MGIHKFSSGFCEVNEQAMRIQLDLNLKIAKLQLKAQPSMPLEVWEQCIGDIQKGLEDIEHALQSCTSLLEESFGILTTLQEDPTIQRLETKAQELQMQYDNMHRTVQIVVLTQWLVRLQ